MTTVLFVIDPQKDFMKSPLFQGSLAVDGAYEDMLRLANHIKTSTPDAIYITLDTHSTYDIAHSQWWVDTKGNAPAPFTIITPEDVKTGKWRAALPEDQEHSEFYVAELARKAKYPLCIWPNHCIKGSEGHEMNTEFAQAVTQWEEKTGKKAIYIYKGMNPKTEHYSGLRAEVELDDVHTQLNVGVISQLDSFDRIEIGGEAQSHCVSSTTMDLLENISDPAKVSILTDCMSSVAGFETQGVRFLEGAQEKGALLRKAQKIGLRM